AGREARVPLVRRHEALELAVRDLVPVDVEALHVDRVLRLLLLLLPPEDSPVIGSAAHLKLARGDVDHALARRGRQGGASDEPGDGGEPETPDHRAGAGRVTAPSAAEETMAAYL